MVNFDTMTVDVLKTVNIAINLYTIKMMSMSLKYFIKC